MSATIYLLTLGLPLATVLLVFWMRARASVQQARLRFGQDEEYRRLAASSAAAQAETAAALAAIQQALADLAARQAAVEKLLAQVQ
jgi:hypothetical protein